MAKKRRRKAASTGKSAGHAPAAGGARGGSKFDPRKWARRAFLALAVLAIPGLIVGMEVRQNQIRQDVRVIGEGQPVVVQAHDPTCPDCRTLLDNLEQAHADFDDRVVLRVVDITSGSGRDFARQYGVGRTTLLLFDASGELLRTIEGVRSADQLRGELSYLDNSGRG